jgi:beta-glucosidase
VKNTGSKAGKEAVLLYVKDETRSISPLVKSLKGFDKALLAAGEQKTFEFEIIPSRDLSFPDDAGRQRLEDGYFYVLIGGLQKRLLLTPKRGALGVSKDAPRTYLQSELFD